jgi:hypothetical protein
MTTTGDLDDPFDPDLDAEQFLGIMPADVLERLWPGFAA